MTQTGTANSDSHTITDMERRKIELFAQIKEEQARHEKTMTGLRDELGIANVRIQMAAEGIDEAQVLLAEHVLSVYGKYSCAGEDRASVLADAKVAILDHGKRMRSEYLGTKSYDRWHGQRCDCGYGMGPRHGTIIFSIGLNEPLRKWPRDLTPDEIEASLYYLNNIERIQKAQATT